MVGEDRGDDVLDRGVDGADHVGVRPPASSEGGSGSCPPDYIEDLGRSRCALVPGQQSEDVEGNRNPC